MWFAGNDLSTLFPLGNLISKWTNSSSPLPPDNALLSAPSSRTILAAVQPLELLGLFLPVLDPFPSSLRSLKRTLDPGLWTSLAVRWLSSFSLSSSDGSEMVSSLSLSVRSQKDWDLLCGCSRDACIAASNWASSLWSYTVDCGNKEGEQQEWKYYY